MKCITLDSAQDYERFEKEFSTRCGNPVDREYLTTSKVRGFFKSGLLVAGYIINSKIPLRYYSWIPDEKRANETLAKTILNSGKACEITCIWINKKAVTKIERNLIYLMSVFDAISEGSRWVVGGSISPKVAKIQKQVLRHRIYLGPVTLPRNPEGELYFSASVELALWMLVAFTLETTIDSLKIPLVALCRKMSHYLKGVG